MNKDVTLKSETEQKWWGLLEGLEFIRSIKDIALEHGFYVGLAGSVLLKGHSQNDLDVILAPLSGRKLNPNAHEEFIFHLHKHTKIGSYGIATEGREAEDKIVVVTWLPSRKRVDFFFPTFLHKDRVDALPNIEDLDYNDY
jgi:hypothetical protein